MVKAFNNTKYDPIGRCIYCGATDDLQNEHIIPFGLSGTAILPESTCGECATITGQQEQLVLRGPMWPVRVYRALKSRTRHKDAPRMYPLTVVRESGEEVVELPLGEYPIHIHFPIFPPPAFLNPHGYTHGIRIAGAATVSFGPNPIEILGRFAATSISLTQRDQPVALARVLAKIAFAMAAAERTLDRISGEPLVLSAILGSTNDIGRWVGTLTEPIQAFDGLLHRVLIHEDINKGLLIGEVHLFSDSQSPRYGVILGHLA